MTTPLLSVVVCTYNRKRLLSRCLESLSRQTLDIAEYEVIIVDNNSIDSTKRLVEQVIKKHANFVLINEPKQGLSHARNKGWRKAQGKYIAFIDDDAFATSTWCERIIEAFENIKPKPVSVGGSIYPLYEVEPPTWFSDELEIRNKGNTPHFLDGKRVKVGFSGSNMAFPRGVLQKYKGFSPGYGVVGNSLRLGDDAELFSRIHEAESGFWYDPNIKVYHWTPVRKMYLRYRIQRSFSAGHSYQAMIQSEVTFLGIIRQLATFSLFLVQLPIKIMKLRNQKKWKQVRLIENLSYRLGLLVRYSKQHGHRTGLT